MKRITTFSLIALVIAGCGGKKTAADLIIRGGTIYTMNAQQPEVEAVAVAGGKIIYAGDADGVTEFDGEKTNSIDLKGRTMTPGL
ncbi:MAG: amidohydrolase, partial [Cyclobacteriaceae bacterium]